MWTPRLLPDRAAYRAIVDALRADIAGGRLRPGDRLPTQRALAQAMNVALGTVTRAYKLAIEGGLIDAQVGSGTFVAHRATGTGATDTFARTLTGFIDLSLDRPLEALSPHLGDTLKRLARRRGVEALLNLQPPEGAARHREAGAAWLERFGVRCAPDDVVLCNGAQHAILVALASSTKPGDAVLVEELTYPGVKAAAAMLGLRLVPVSLDGDGVLPGELERLCKARKPRAVYLTPSLQNPTNAQLTAERRERVAQIIERHDLMLIEDEVRVRSATKGPEPIQCAIPSRTCFIGGFSKSVGSALRVSFVAAPRHHVAAMRRAVWASVWTISSLPLEIAASWIEDGTADRTVTAKIKEAKRRQALARKLLGHWSIRALPASHTLWLELPREVELRSVLAALEQRRVRVSPAETFSVAGRRSPKCVRICLGAAETLADLELALTEIRDVLLGRPLESAIGLN